MLPKLSLLVVFATVSTLFVLIVAFLVPALFHEPTPPQYETFDSPTGFSFEIASTSAAREKGLGGRVSIDHNYGMLFVFPDSDKHGFWMKDMRVPIDIVWLDENGVIVGIDASVTPDTYPTVFYPPQPVRYVLETRAEEASAQGWTIGTALSLPL